MKSRQRRGFAMLVAVGMVGLVAAVALGLTLYLAADVRRTGDGEIRAQLDQLLLAGAAMAGEHPDAPAGIELPASLRERGALLSIDPTPENGQIRTVITAAIDGQSASQSLILRRVGDRWAVVDAVR